MPYTRGPTNAIRRHVGQIPPLGYLTPWGTSRACEVSVALPDVPGSYPLILFSHGGSSGAAPGAYKTSPWIDVFAEYGYVVVMLSHTEPGGGVPHTEQDEIDAVAAHLGVSVQPFKVMNYFRLLDIDAVLGKMRRLNRELSSRFGVTIDHNAGYALAGHSAGSGAALTVAGARRFYDGCAGPSYSHSAPEPATCYLAYSIQGPADEDHLCDPDSWTSIPAATPVLAVTGAGDSATAVNRRLAYGAMAGTGSSKYEFWLTDAAPQHGFYNHKKTAGFGTELVWMEDVSLAFVDDHLKGVTAARDYLENSDVVTDSGGVVDWTKK